MPPELLAQLVDVDVEDVGPRVEPDAPCVVEDLVARAAEAGVGHEVGQQIELFRGQLQLGPAEAYAAGRAIEQERTHAVLPAAPGVGPRRGGHALHAEGRSISRRSADVRYQAPERQQARFEQQRPERTLQRTVCTHDEGGDMLGECAPADGKDGHSMRPCHPSDLRNDGSGMVVPVHEEHDRRREDGRESVRFGLQHVFWLQRAKRVGSAPVLTQVLRKRLRRAHEAHGRLRISMRSHEGRLPISGLISDLHQGARLSISQNNR